MTHALNGFINFIREQGIVGLAIGFILGGSVTKVVTSFVQDIVQPLIGLIFGSTSGLKTIHIGPVMLGSFAANLIDLLIIAAVVYFAFHQLRDVLDKKKEA